MSISFLIFLVIIGITSIYQISNVNSKVMELNDLRMTPIMELESIKSNVEYIRSECIALMNSSDDETFKSIQSEIDATEATLLASFEEIINNHVQAAKQTYDDSKVTYNNTLIAVISLLIICAIIVLILSIIITRSMLW